MNSALEQCSLRVNTTLPLVCICSLFSFLCGVGIGANDLSANFAMVVGSGSLNMKQAIIYCSLFELLGAAFMGGHVSDTIRNGIVEPVLFKGNRDVVVVGMTAASFAAALWLYMSTVFGLPVSITHTVVGSLLGFAVFSTFSFDYVKARGLVVIVISWVAAPVAACLVTAVIFYVLRRDVFKVKGRSFSVALKILPLCLAASLLVDYAFVIIEEPPIMTVSLARYVPLTTQLAVLLGLILVFCVVAARLYFPHVAHDAWASSSFVWESRAIRTEPVELPQEEVTKEEAKLDLKLSFFNKAPLSSSTTSSSSSSRSASASSGGHSKPREGESSPKDTSLPPAPRANLSPSTVLSSPGGAPSQPENAPVATSAVVYSTINPSDSRVVHRGEVRLAPTGRQRSTVPNASVLGSICANDLAAVPSTEGALNSRAVSGLFTPSTARGRSASRLSAARGVPSASHSEYGTVPLGEAAALTGQSGTAPLTELSPLQEPGTPASVCSADVFNDDDWGLDHAMEPIRFGGLLIKPFNPRAEYLFTGLQVVAGSMSSFVHGAVAGANATATFVILYEAFTNHELGEVALSSDWSVLPAMLGIAIGMFALGSSLMKTVGMELVTVTPARGWCIQVGGTSVTMVLTGLGIPVSLSQSQVGAAIGCGLLDAKLAGVSWPLVGKIVGGWFVTLLISAVTTGAAMWFMYLILC